MYRTISFCCLMLICISCVKTEKLNIDVSEVEVNTVINRFDQDFYHGDPNNLANVKSKYPYLFPVQESDTIWIAKMNDEDELALLKAAENVFGDFKSEEGDLTELYKHIKYYYPAFKAPKAITLLTNIDYKYKVIYADSLLLIPMDLYLGVDSEFYSDFPIYLKQNFVKDRLIVDAAEAITQVQIPMTNDRTFVSKMIQEGKKMYLFDAYLPLMVDSIKLGYTTDQINWADQNQTEVWKYFVQKELLYSTDAELNRRFMEPGPFSKFFQANDNETPARIGVWFGWQIVKAFMDKTNTTVQELLNVPNEEIFKKSKYKPAK